MELSYLKELILCARGETPADLFITNGTLINVITRELYKADLAILGNRIVNVAEPGELKPENSHKLLDVSGKYLSPGLIEPHLHIESTMLMPNEFSKLAVLHGTTTVLLDPHELGNSLGIEGLNLLLRQVEQLPLRFLIEIPSCVPAAPGLETSGHVIDSKAIEDLILTESRFFGLGEVMNYPGVLFGDTEVLTKVILGDKLSVIDGHSPNVSGRDLDAYITTGIRSDHECTTPEELIEKLRKGMNVMLREGSLAKDLRNLLKGIKGKDLDLRNCLLCSDDRNIIDLYANGHMNAHVRMAVEEGIDPITALQMVTINPATYLGLHTSIGSLAPGKIADIVIFDDLKDFKVSSGIFGGTIVYSKGAMNWDFTSFDLPSWSINTVKLPSIQPEVFCAKSNLPDGIHRIRIIGVRPYSVLTDSLEYDLKVENGWIHPQPENDILSLAVVERYGINGNIANAFIRGFGIKIEPFAMATTVAHDTHNLLVTGTDNMIMAKAVELLNQINGGYVVIAGEKIHKIPLSFGGIMSLEPYHVLHSQLTNLNKLFKDITEFKEPLMALSFMALPVIPHLKVTDKGLVDVDKFAFTDLVMN